MSTQLKEPEIAEQPTEVEEGPWQASVEKNRELDRRGAARRLQFILVALTVGVATVVAAALYRYLR